MVFPMPICYVKSCAQQKCRIHNLINFYLHFLFLKKKKSRLPQPYGGRVFTLHSTGHLDTKWAFIYIFVCFFLKASLKAKLVVTKNYIPKKAFFTPLFVFLFKGSLKARQVKNKNYRPKKVFFTSLFFSFCQVNCCCFQVEEPKPLTRKKK